MADDREFHIDAADFSRVMRNAKEFSPALAREVRKGIREAAKSAVADVKAELGKPPPSGGKRSTGVRAALAAGTSLRITTSERSRTQGVRIVTSGSRLPAERRPMLRLYNKRSWRHPVFGDREQWRGQAGRPYFGKVIYEHSAEIRQAVIDAMGRAGAVMRNNKGTP